MLTAPFPGQKKTAVVWIFLFLFCLPNACAEEKPLHLRAAVLSGYDNNAGLNAERNADGFAQENVSVLYQRLLNQKTQMRLSYGVLNVNYFEATDINVLAQNASAGLNFLLAPQTVLETNYTFEYLDFPSDSAINSYSNEGRVGLRQRVGKRWILRSGVSVSGRGYTERKLRQPDGIPSPDDERGDGRVAIDGLASFKWLPQVVLNAGGMYYWNDSNDLFHDYYDYEAYRLIAGAFWQIGPKLSSSVRFIYEKRAYDARPLLDSASTFEKDDLYTTYASLFYKLNADLSLGSVYTYRQKNSNEPSQKYSGSTGTLGLYYSF